jgi:hypothetical protein
MTTATHCRTVYPAGYTPPVALASGALLTCRRVVIGGSLSADAISRAARPKCTHQQSAFTRAAQRSLLSSRSAQARKSLLDRLVAYC